jgi:branched-chain amino acid transport system substrate-binding protein
MRTWRTFASLLAVGSLAIAITACGGDDDDDAATADTPSGNSGSGELQLDSPVKIEGAVEIAGESDAAVNSFDYGIRLAIDQINADGGIGGQQIEYDRVPLSISDGSRATSQFLEAVDKQPSAIIGLPSNVQHGYLKTNIDRAQIPVISISPAATDSYFGNDAGSEYLWTVPTYSSAISHAGTRFLVDELGAETVGLMGTNEAYGNSSIEGSKDELDQLGMEAADIRQHAPDATDLTNDVLAMKDVDAIADWDYPNPLAVILKQLQQNDLNVPIISGESASLVVDNELATGEAIDNLYSAAPCSPATEDTPELAAFNQAYNDEYGESPNSLATNAYDGIYILKAAIEKAGSAEPQAINDALDGLDVTDGVACAPEYQADGAHVFGHTVTIIKFAADGSKTVATTIDVDPVEEGGG